jgi:hypothetical protein
MINIISKLLQLDVSFWNCMLAAYNLYMIKSKVWLQIIFHWCYCLLTWSKRKIATCRGLAIWFDMSRWEIEKLQPPKKIKKKQNGKKC